MLKLQAMIFDMDGTLVDTLPIVFQSLNDTFRIYAGREFSWDEMNGMFGPSEEGVITPQVPAASAPAAIHHYQTRYAALHAPFNQPFAGSLELLKHLRGRGIKTGIVTGKGRITAEISMKAFGLAQYIDALATGSPHGAEKDTAIRAMLDGWGIDPQQAAYVGDTPYDMCASRDAGVLPIGAGWAATATVQASDGLVFSTFEALHAWVMAQV